MFSFYFPAAVENFTDALPFTPQCAADRFFGWKHIPSVDFFIPETLHEYSISFPAPVMWPYLQHSDFPQIHFRLDDTSWKKRKLNYCHTSPLRSKVHILSVPAGSRWQEKHKVLICLVSKLVESCSCTGRVLPLCVGDTRDTSMLSAMVVGIQSLFLCGG